MLKLPSRLFLLMSFIYVTSVHAQEIWFESGPQQTVMIELFTSEGCSSCPPAEELLNTYKENKQLWKTFVPLAWHVDYWDYLGWKDRYAKPAHSQRQRRYAQLRRVRTVYTPAFIVNGKGWGPGFFSGEPDTTTGKVGVLKVMVDDKIVTASFKPATRLPHTLNLNIAILGMELMTEIRAGENEGRTSPHEFVVLGHRKVSGHNYQWQTTLPAIQHKADRYALVAWISTPDNPTPLQSTGGYLPISIFNN